MYSLLSGLKHYFQRQEITIDNPVFRMHCTFTTALISAFGMIITWPQFAGQAIKCNMDGVPARVINTYCWIMDTFTVPDAFNRPRHTVAHPGIGIASDSDDESSRKYYTYYQWVTFVLFFQALLCYLPKWLWETWERGLMKTIVCGLNNGLRTEEENNEKKGILIDYLIKHLNQHDMYAFRYWFCEILCFANIVFQMYFMNWFFNGDFTSYGLDVLTFDDKDYEDRTDNMVYVFPRVTKCIFRKFGPSGTIETRDALCVLPLNIVNEKTYIFLWFWFMILAILTAIVVVCRGLILYKPSLRPLLMRARSRMVPEKAIKSVSKRVSVGDWWVLYMLANNIDPKIYKEVIVEFAKKKDIGQSTKQLRQAVERSDSD